MAWQDIDQDLSDRAFEVLGSTNGTDDVTIGLATVRGVVHAPVLVYELEGGVKEEQRIAAMLPYAPTVAAYGREPRTGDAFTFQSQVWYVVEVNISGPEIELQGERRDQRTDTATEGTRMR